MFCRGIQRAYLKPSASPGFAPSGGELARFGILAMSLFRFEDMLAVYYESMGGEPELFSSYVFHHYQLQEERPGFGDQYGLICFDDGPMCFYMELPEEREPDPSPGALDTHNAPLEHWHELMGQHFVPWRDTNQPWKQMRCLFSYIPESAG